MLQAGFDLGQMLRDANIFSVEDLEKALQDNGDASIGQVIKKEATWSSFRQLLTTDLLGNRASGGGRALQSVLERAGWISAEQLGRVLESIDQYGEGLGQRLLQAGLLDEDQLKVALDRQSEGDRSLWRILVNAGFVDLMQICVALKIEDRLLGQTLVTQGQIDVKTLQAYLDQANHSRYPMARLLVQDEKIDADSIARRWSELYNVPYRDIAKAELDPELLRGLKSDQLSEFLAVPLERNGDVLTLAVGNPSNVARLRFLWPRPGTRLRVVFSPIDQILDQIEAFKSMTGDDGQGGISLSEQAQIDPASTPSDIVNATMAEAFSNRATDVHFDPGWNEWRVRLRVDGVLHDLLAINAEKGTHVISRLKALANLDTSEHRRIQTGHLVMPVGTELAEMRISTVPTRHGEKCVVRLMSPTAAVSDFSDLGMSEDQAGAVDEMLAQPCGLVLCAGPVGSGTTTTLYSALSRLSDPGRNVVTLEDPVEHSLPRVNQIEVRENTGVTYSEGLRALMRLDPDVLMLGEIRDPESARLAVRASMSGILVLGTIRSNDATGAVGTLIDLGISPYLAGNCLLGTISQRLTRRICPNCAEAHEPDAELLSETELEPGTDPISFQRGAGCGECLGTGYRGLVGVFEVLRVNDSLRRMIRREASRAELRDEAIRNGMRTLISSARDTMGSGLTTAEEFLKMSVL